MSPTKTLKRGVAPIGDCIEPVGESRADVEIGNEGFQQAERNRTMKNQDKLSTGVGAPRVSKVEVLVDNIELNNCKKKKEKGRLRL